MKKKLLTKDEQELFNSWKNSGCYSVKMSQYFSVYSELLKKFRNKKCKLVEIGVLDGGSLYAWRDYLGEKAEIIGIDLNPNAKRFEKDGFKIFIGDQSDAEFWRYFYSEVKNIDILIDDGGHSSHQQVATLICALVQIKTKAIVIIEDTHSNFFTYLSKFEGENSFLNFSKQATDNLTLRQVFNTARPERFPRIKNPEALNLFRNVRNINFYNGIVAYHLEPYDKRFDSLTIANMKIKDSQKEKFEDYKNRSSIHGLSVNWPNPLKKEERIIRGKNFSDSNTQKIQSIKIK